MHGGDGDVVAAGRQRIVRAQSQDVNSDRAESGGGIDGDGVSKCDGARAADFAPGGSEWISSGKPVVTNRSLQYDRIGQGNNLR